MSSAKFFVWGGGRWRELNTESGQVAGWSRRARFVFARRGRLRVAARRRVLAALQAHAANQLSAVSLGPRLSVLSKEPVSPCKQKALPSAPPAPCEHHHCCLYTHGYHNNNNLGKTCRHNGASDLNGWSPRIGSTTAFANSDIAADSTPTTNDALAILQRCNVSTQHSLTVDVAVQHAPRDHRPFTINLAETTVATLNSIPQRHRKPALGGTKRIYSRAPQLEVLLKKHASPVKRHRLTSDSDDTEKSFRRPSKARCREDANSQERAEETGPKTERSCPSSSAKVKREHRSDSESSDDAAEVCKELTISESDVTALRSYVARTRRDALPRFDADDAYKRMLFYAINPLVDVERCAHTERALRERHAMALPHFAARLGLAPHGAFPPAPPSPRTRVRAPVRYRERSSSPDTDKENKQNTKRNDNKRDSSTTKITKIIKPNLEDSDTNDENKLFQKSSGKQRGSTLKKTNNRNAEVSDSDAESDLFENTRNLKLGHRVDVKSTTQAKPRGSGSDSPHTKSIRNTVNVNNDEKRQTLRKPCKNRHVSNHISNKRKRDTSRHKVATEPKPDTKDAENAETLKKNNFKRENRTPSDNRRESLRHRTVDQIKTTSDDSESDDKRDTLGKNGTDGNRRGILRHKNMNQTKTSSDDSNSDEQREIVKTNEDKHEIRTSGNRRKVLLHKTANQTTTTSDDSESDEKRKTVEKSKGKRENRTPSDNRRVSLRHRTVNQTKTSLDNSESDDERDRLKKSEGDREIRAPDKRRRGMLRHKTANQATITSDDSESNEKRKIVDKSEVTRGSHAHGYNRRESLRHRTMNHTKTSSDDSESDEKRKAVEKSESKREIHAPGNNRRVSLRHKTVNETKTSSDNSESDEKSINTKKSEVERQNRAPSDNRRESLRHKTVDQTKTSSDDSENEEIFKTSKGSEGKRENRTPSDNRRESLRHKTVNQTKTRSDDSESDEKLETLKKSEINTALGRDKKGKFTRRPKPKTKNTDNIKMSKNSNHKKRLRDRSNSNAENADSDFKGESTSHRSRENKRRSVTTLTHKHIEESDSTTTQEKPVTRIKSPVKSRQGNVSGRTGASAVDSEDTGGLKPARDATPSTKPVHSKTKQPSKAANRLKTEPAPAVAVPKGTHVISKRVSSGKLKEYSNLEDHAIVAWVASGARARRVNGNALWRELQDAFPRLAGNSRSWHSLRNRYLRYILPALGALRLPPADVSRLRAAAATGEIKHKRAGLAKARRNSIFDQTAVRAASRQKRAPSSPPPAPPSPPPATPSPPPASHSEPPADTSAGPSEAGPSGSRRPYFVAPRAYSDVRHSTRDEDAGTSTSRRRSRRSQVSPPPPIPQSSRGRKLFNPKQVL